MNTSLRTLLVALAAAVPTASGPAAAQADDVDDHSYVQTNNSGGHSQSNVTRVSGTDHYVIERHNTLITFNGTSWW
ncbi:hypothetical protein ACFP1Z_10115 [Streptomyces gamaensis]|uniref:Uncharacterized protein n=1 Tax=Streptomyces gamaensis TaxID=1763542 RepID=A0ABW0YVE3_9ACTN